MSKYKENINDDTMKYKKKKNQSSKSSKHSKHKHEYEDILLKTFLYGFVWEERCKICGRLKSKSFDKMEIGTTYTTFDENNRKLIKHYTAEELHAKFPNTKIFYRPKNEKGHINFEDNAIIEIIFD